MKLFSKQLLFLKVSQNDVSDMVILLSKNLKKILFYFYLKISFSGF